MEYADVMQQIKNESDAYIKGLQTICLDHQAEKISDEEYIYKITQLEIKTRIALQEITNAWVKYYHSQIRGALSPTR